MEAHPLNRRFVVEKQKAETLDDGSGIIIPEGHAKHDDPNEHNIYKIVAASADTNKPLKPGDLVVLEEEMLEVVRVQGTQILMIQENYLKARVRSPS